jgi:hypothetical protein
MPETIVEQQQKPPAAPERREVSGKWLWFPRVTWIVVVASIVFLTYHMDDQVMSGSLSGAPYVLLLVLFAVIFVVDFFLFREE